MNYKEIIDLSSKKSKLYTKNELFPQSIILETTNYCNLSCSCCGHNKMTREKGFMELSLYKSLISEIAQENPVADLWMVFYGEPLILNYKLVYLIQLAKEKGLKNVFLNTNGLLLNNELSEALVESGVDKIVVSLDAYFEETYKKIRNNNHFEKVKNNIEELIHIKSKSNSDIKIEIQLIELPGIHRNNEIDLFQEYWRSKGADTKIKPYVTWTGAIDVNKMRHEYRYPCSWLFKTFVVTWNGDVAQCGCDYDKKFIAGNVKDNTIKEIWQTTLKKVRDLHLQEKYDETPICGNCKDWDSYVIMPFLKKD